MSFDESLAARVRDCLAHTKGIVEKKMFGSACFLLNGNLIVGVWKDSLIARVGPAAYEDALNEDHVREFDVTGRPMRGWVMVDPAGVEEDDSLAEWIERATRFVRSLPAR